MKYSTKTFGLSALVVAIFSYGVTASAMTYPEDVIKQIDMLSTEYLGAPGYEEVEDVLSLTDDNWYTEENFPDSTDDKSVFLADANISPVQKAVMLVRNLEGDLPHSRYRVRYHNKYVSNDNFTAAPRAYIEVTRFNLGPARYDYLTSTEIASDVANKKEFGVGPNVSWRFVMSSIQGQLSAIDGAARKELSEIESHSANCLGTPCMKLADISGPSDKWQEMSVPDSDSTEKNSSPFVSNAYNLGQVTRVMMLESIGPEYGEPVEGLKPGENDLELVISNNVTGQAENIQAVLHQSHIMDDAISDIWLKRIQFEGGLIWENIIVYRPGRS